MLYFAPKSKTWSAELAAELSTVIAQPETRETMDGPGGVAGLLIAQRGTIPTSDIQHRPDEQTWSQAYGRTTLIGVINGKSIDADAYARDFIIPGETFELLDGSKWTIPKVRTWRHNGFSPALPRVLVQCLKTGEMIPGDVTPAYRELSDLSVQMANGMMQQLRGGAESVEVSDRMFDAFVGKLFETNYRISLPELSALKLFERVTFSRVLLSALDLNVVLASAKNALGRSIASGTNSDTGEMPSTADSDTTICPPSEN